MYEKFGYRPPGGCYYGTGRHYSLIIGKIRVTGLFIIVLVSLVSCAPGAWQSPPDPFNPVYTVAVLPFYNASNDVDGPRMIRDGVYERMQGKYYSIMSLSDTDSVLVNRMGITLGSQLEMTDPVQLGDILGVDGVVYGYVLNFDDVTTGVYNVKKVRAGVKLVDTRTGNVIWSGGLGVRAALAGGGVGEEMTRMQENGKEGAGEFGTIKGIEDIQGLDRWHTIKTSGQETVGRAAMMAIGEKFLTSAFGVHLKAETDTMLNRIMADFPAGPGTPRE